MQPRLKPLAAALALYAAHGLAAEDVSILGEVLVTAPREVPLSSGSYILNDAAIAPQRARTSDTASLLADIPGVSAYGAGGVSSLPVIRGLADDRLRTKVDGMDLVAACPNHMNSPLSYIDPTAVDGYQVYAGVTPVSVGGDSIGGSIAGAVGGPRVREARRSISCRGRPARSIAATAIAGAGISPATFATESVSLSYTGAYAQSDNYKAGDDFKDYTLHRSGGPHAADWTRSAPPPMNPSTSPSGSPGQNGGICWTSPTVSSTSRTRAIRTSAWT